MFPLVYHSVSLSLSCFIYLFYVSNHFIYLSLFCISIRILSCIMQFMKAGPIKATPFSLINAISWKTIKYKLMEPRDVPTIALPLNKTKWGVPEFLVSQDL